MPAVELWNGRLRERLVDLDAPTLTIGTDPSVDLPVADPTVSRVHAVLERVGSTWLVRDLGSSNGTFLGGERLLTQRQLRDGDELRLGRTRLVFRDLAAARGPRTDALTPPPANLTRRQREVLVALCRPLLANDAFQEPASVREMAARLVMGRNGVQQHLEHLYDVFGIHQEEGVNRRVRLANEAISRGAVTIGDLRDEDGSDG